jgi:hypothetical protein
MTGRVILCYMDLGSALSLGTMLSAAVTALKDAKELATDVEDVDLKEKIGAAYDTLLELKIRLYEYDDEVRRLRQELETQNSFVGPVEPFSYVYRAEDKERNNPLCPKCFQKVPRVVSYLSAQRDYGVGVNRGCNQCSWLNFETRTGSTGGQQVRGYWE